MVVSSTSSQFQFIIQGYALAFTIVPFFIHCTNFLGYFNFLNIEKEFEKFSIVGKPLPNGVLQWKLFCKKRRIKVEKTEIQNFQLFM